MKLKKEIILTALITAVITGTVAVTAVSLTAKDIGFKPNNQEWDATNVEDAMNDLYNIGKEVSGKKIYKLGQGRSFSIADIVGKEKQKAVESTGYLEGTMKCLGTAIRTVGKQGMRYKTTGSISIHRQEGHQYTTITSQQEFVKTYDQTSGVINITGGTFQMHQTVSGDDTVFKSTTTVTPIVYFIDNIEIVE